MSPCVKCGAGEDHQNLSFSDGRHEFWSCLGCGKMRTVRVQQARGHKVTPLQKNFFCVECSGEIDCPPGSDEPPGSEPVWKEDALAQMRAHYQKLES